MYGNTKHGYYHLMMKSKVFRSTVVLFLFAIHSWGQVVISGKVTDSENLPVSEAEIYLSELQRTVLTSETGYFEFKDVPIGSYSLIAFAYGLKLHRRNLEVKSDMEIHISMEPLGEALSEVVLTNQREQIFKLQSLKKVEGTAIYAAKKSEVVLVDNLTANLAANNPRQIYGQVVGLNIYENGDAGLQLNIGGRGLDPNRTANFNVRQNGYDISADALGYPESYYTPPAEALREIQVVRGAASLQYGPQFGGLVNFKFKRPNPSKEIELISRQTLGSYNLYTSFNSLSGTVGDFSYYTYLNYKEGDGFRPNMVFNSRNFHGHFSYKITERTSLALETTFFNYLTKQPGGLTDSQFLEDPSFSNRERNWFQVDWKLFSLRLDHQFSKNTDFSLNLFTLDASRSALGFRTNRVSQQDDPSEPRELLQDNFSNWGAEGRLLTRYKMGGKDNAVLLGIKYYQSSNKQKQGPGSASDSPDFSFADDQYPNYERQSQYEFPNLNLAIFGENIFTISDRLSVTPGFRYEYIKTQGKGSYKNIVLDLAGNPLLNEDVPEDRIFERSFLLLGAGLSYELGANSELYANFSQNYRSVTFNDIRVVNPTFQVDENISDENGFTADLGTRGRWKKYLKYDLSVFGLLYDDRLGEVLRNETQVNANGETVETGRVVRFRGNIGTAFLYGLESFADVNLKPLLFSRNDNLKFNYFVNLALTGSEYISFEENNVDGNQVEFIPEVNLKTGFNVGYGNFLGSIQYTYLSEQFTDATNAPRDVYDNQRGIEGTIPAYDIMDLSLSYVFDRFKIETGVNNLLNSSYFTRRATGYPGPGIIPAEPRTFYMTFQIKL